MRIRSKNDTSTLLIHDVAFVESYGSQFCLPCEDKDLGRFANFLKETLTEYLQKPLLKIFLQIGCQLNYDAFIAWVLVFTRKALPTAY